MPFIITRTATKNPAINGRTLYCTNIGSWTLNPKHAMRFASQDEAEKSGGFDRECKATMINEDGSRSIFDDVDE